MVKRLLIFLFLTICIFWIVSVGLPKPVALNHFVDASTISSMAYSNDGTLLATSDDQGTVYIWQVIDGKLLRTFPKQNHTNQPVSHMVFNPDGQTIATVSHNSDLIHLWQIESGQMLQEFRRQGIVDGLAFSNNGKELIIAERPHDDLTGSFVWLRLADQAIQKVSPQTYEGALYGFSLSPDEQMLAAGSWGKLYIWHLIDNSMIQIRNPEKADRVYVAWSPDGNIVASASREGKGHINLWQANNGQHIEVVSNMVSESLFLRESPFSTNIRACLLEQGLEQFVCDVFSRPLYFLDDYDVFSFASDPKGKFITFGYKDGVARIWSMQWP